MNTNHGILLCCAALVLGSCTTKNQESFLVLQKAVSPKSSAALDGGNPNAGCTYDASSSPAAIEGFWPTEDFALGLVLANDLSDNSNPNTGRLNTNVFNATRARITYESTDGSFINIPEQSTPTQGQIDSTTVGVVVAVLIPAAVTAQLATVTSVRLHVRVEGELLDGSTVTSSEYLMVARPVSALVLDTSQCTNN